jgi:hypothetical protein
LPDPGSRPCPGIFVRLAAPTGLVALAVPVRGQPQYRTGADTMTVLRWTYVGTLSDPIFIVSTALFVIGAVLIAWKSRSVFAAGESGAIYGFVYGVIVWGLIGYAYGFEGQLKLIFAGCSLVDAVVLCAVLNFLIFRSERRDAAAAG